MPVCVCKYFSTSFSRLTDFNSACLPIEEQCGCCWLEWCVKRKVNASRGNLSQNSLAKQTAPEEKLLLICELCMAISQYLFFLSLYHLLSTHYALFVFRTHAGSGYVAISTVAQAG